MMTAILVLPTRISDKLRPANSLTIQMSKFDKQAIITPIAADTVGKKTATISFRYPSSDTRPIKGETRTVQKLVKYWIP